MRRPLLTLLAAVAAAIGISVLIIPWDPRDYETLRGSTVDLTGTICDMEPALASIKDPGCCVQWRTNLQLI